MRDIRCHKGWRETGLSAYLYIYWHIYIHIYFYMFIYILPIYLPINLYLYMIHIQIYITRETPGATWSEGNWRIYISFSAICSVFIFRYFFFFFFSSLDLNTSAKSEISFVVNYISRRLIHTFAMYVRFNDIFFS